MKHFILALSLIFAAPLLQAIVTDDDILTQHRQDFARVHPGITPIYVDMNSNPVSMDVDHARKFLMVRGKDLNAQKQQLSTYFKTHPDVTLLIDFEKNGGFVSDGGELRFEKADLPEHVTSLWISNKAEDIVKIGYYFLWGCESLTSLDLSHLSGVTSLGECFLSDCNGFTSLDLSPLSQVTSIERGFLRRCYNLTSLDLSPLSNVTSLGDSFLFSCRSLTSLDLSPLSNVTSLGDWFLRCCRGLTSLDLSPLRNVTSLGECFLGSCDRLTALLSPERTTPFVLKAAVKMLRESNYPFQQELGAALYQNYLLEIPENLKQLLASLNCDRLRAMAPQALADLPDMLDLSVVNAYDVLIDGAQLDATEVAAYPDHLKPHLSNLFLGTNNRVTWAIRDQYKSPVKIAFKHILKKLQDLPQGSAEIKTYLTLLIHSFQHCESRFIGTLNQILMQMGLSSALSQDSVESKLWGLVNTQKLEAFNHFVSDDDGADVGAHAYGRKFTVVNNAVGLPVAIRNFEERISSLSDEEMQEQLGLFLGGYFNKESLIDALHQKLTAAEEIIPVKRLRSWMGQTEEMAVLRELCPDFDEGVVDDYYLHWAGSDADSFDYNTTPITKGELGRLLVLMGVLCPALDAGPR